jgi:hypothetical protein
MHWTLRDRALDALNLVPSEEVRGLREQGVFNRIWVDTSENLVTIVEMLARAVFNAAVSDATSRVKRKGNIFQRLDDLADLFVDAGYPDVRTLVSDGVWLRCPWPRNSRRRSTAQSTRSTRSPASTGRRPSGP